MDLEATILLMRKHRVTRLQHDGLVIEMAPEPPAWPAQDTTSNPNPPCKCGHSVAIEHNDQGLCLQGCEVETCHPAS